MYAIDCIDIPAVVYFAMESKGGEINVIDLTNVSKRYHSDAPKALDNLNLHVEGGQLYGFIGPNGAGKSTAIKLMCGILKPDEGSVKIAGYDVAQDRLSAQQNIGYVPDNNDLYDRLTGMEYLNFMGDIYGVSAAQRKALEQEGYDPDFEAMSVSDMLRHVRRALNNAKA